MMPESTLPAHVGADLERRGYCVVENFLEAAATAALAGECFALHARNQLRPAAVGHADERQVDSRMRGDRTRWFDPEELTAAESAYWTAMDTLRRSLNRRLLLGMDEFEAHYALYAAGTHYARHHDRFRDDDARVLSSVLYLNLAWHDADGGALRLYLDAAVPDAHLDIYPRDGTLVLFLSADFEHEVLPATRERLSVAGWFRSAR
jgi:SM-20-related protein